MSNQNDSFNPDRNLVDVFKELQQKRAEDSYTYQKENPKDNSFHTGITTYFSSNRKTYNTYSYGKKIKKQKATNQTKTLDYTKLSVGIIIIILIVSLALLFLSYSFTTYGLEEQEEVSQAAEAVNYEANQNVLDITKIISDNIDTSTIKETINEERELNFPIKYTTVDNLPKGEEETIQNGVNGTNKVTAVRTYENGNLVDENIISTTVIKEPTPQLVNIGTSEFLAKYKVHIGDLMYVISDVTLRATPNDTARSVAEIPSTLDVKLLQLEGDWCKVSYDNQEGYVRANVLTSASEAPEMVDKARVQRILRDVKINMPLNKKSGLAESDFKKILSGNASDTNKIFENNYKAFFDIEQKYGVNGIFLASLAIHESAWGTSQIASDKKNLFGYGSFDRDSIHMKRELKL